MQNIRNALKPDSACLCIWIGIRLPIRNDFINDRNVYHSQLINRQGQHGPLWQTAYIKLNGERNLRTLKCLAVSNNTQDSRLMASKIARYHVKRESGAVCGKKQISPLS